MDSPETPLAAIFDDKSDKRRVTGPVAMAIDGNANTAWGIDVGPGRRNQPRKAVFVADKPIENDGGTIFNVYLNQNHGGWNSDDNQNNNLGRIRLSVTSLPEAQADPLPAEVRQIFEFPPRSERRVRSTRFSATCAPHCPRREPMSRSKSCGNRIRRVRHN